MLKHKLGLALRVLLLLRLLSLWPHLGEKVSVVHTAGGTLLLTPHPISNLDGLIPQDKAQHCNLALLLPPVETQRSDPVSSLLPTAGRTSMVEGGLKGWSQDPEAP